MISSNRVVSGGLQDSVIARHRRGVSPSVPVQVLPVEYSVDSCAVFCVSASCRHHRKQCHKHHIQSSTLFWFLGFDRGAVIGMGGVNKRFFRFGYHLLPSIHDTYVFFHMHIQARFL